MFGRYTVAEGIYMITVVVYHEQYARKIANTLIRRQGKIRENMLNSHHIRLDGQLHSTRFLSRVTQLLRFG